MQPAEIVNSVVMKKAESKNDQLLDSIVKNENTQNKSIGADIETNDKLIRSTQEKNSGKNVEIEEPNKENNTIIEKESPQIVNEPIKTEEPINKDNSVRVNDINTVQEVVQDEVSSNKNSLILKENVTQEIGDQQENKNIIITRDTLR